VHLDEATAKRPFAVAVYFHATAKTSETMLAFAHAVDPDTLCFARADWLAVASSTMTAEVAYPSHIENASAPKSTINVS
jgi:hypothetical protein